VALAVFAVPLPIVLADAGLAGWLLGRYALHTLNPVKSPGADDAPAPLIDDDALHHATPALRRSATVAGRRPRRVGGIGAAVLVLTGPASVFSTQALFFSGTAMVTFGGAYAVLAFVAQRAVEVYGWLAPAEMVRGRWWRVRAARLGRTSPAFRRWSPAAGSRDRRGRSAPSSRVGGQRERRRESEED
jgi:chromate transporter